jgi:hypothetical protein
MSLSRLDSLPVRSLKLQAASTCEEPHTGALIDRLGKSGETKQIVQSPLIRDKDSYLLWGSPP